MVDVAHHKGVAVEQHEAAVARQSERAEFGERAAPAAKIIAVLSKVKNQEIGSLVVASIIS